ncbi:aspartate kinase [Alicyclobacillus sp. SO9]|uniref:aspartate kinase n=1 Tax=Alicyclobacillus sp. SO9 TaxID=2665646 RepID=UPI0018E83C5B|nr:aspartate kinase [Alicyclobacillus sp. SO9]QQE80673.1 aspartate kinase [Alicyclobacillus sp. SO9]
MRIVQKYGGTSVGSLERIEAVADRVAKTVQAGNECAVVVSAMGKTTDQLVELAKGLTNKPDARELDALLSTGEQVSAALLSMALHKRNITAKSYTGWQAGIETEAIHGTARMTNVRTEFLEQALKDGIVPVVTGFQGIAGDSVTTLGRGGSDTTAVVIAAALDADVCEIYTDVTGVFTTDPRTVPNARKIKSLQHEEMLELATLGAQVLHPRAVENAKKFSVRLVVKSSFSEEEGTEIVADLEGLELQKPVTGIATEKSVARIAVVGVPVNRHGLAKMFSKLAEERVNVDVIVQSVVKERVVDVSFTVQEQDVDEALAVVEGLRTELGFEDVIKESGLAKISIVGAGMISNPGVAGEMFEILASADVTIKMVSTSEIKVSCIIPASQLATAVSSVHSAFLEGVLSGSK